MDDFFDRTAAVGSDEDEEMDDETGEPVNGAGKSRARNGDMNDSSEEEEDDDEEEARRIREGFIVDEDEEDEEAKERRREKRKRRREEKGEEEEQLDQEDLELIGITAPEDERVQGEPSKFKRLKRGHREERAVSEARGVEDIFSDDEEGVDGAARPARTFGYPGDDLDDFIEQDEFPDEEQGMLDEDAGIRAPKRAGYADLQNLKDSGLGEAVLEDMRVAFGDGDEFGWALDAEQAHNEDTMDPEKTYELKDVFEPSQLAEKMLTEGDNVIRSTDVPERFQELRKPYRNLADLSEEEQETRNAEEAAWITSTLWPRRRMDPRLKEPFEAAVKQVLHFMNVEDFEPPFIFQNRKDYLIHSEQIPLSPLPGNPDAPKYKVQAEKLLGQEDLWTILEQDLKFRAFEEKRLAIRNGVDAIKETATDFNDTVFEDLVPAAAVIDDLQDLQDYLNFQFSQQLKDISLEQAETNGTQKRARGARSMWDKVRSGSAYHLVRAFGITADAVARNAERGGNRTFTEDSDQRPDDLADTLVQAPEFTTGEDVFTAAKAMFVEELVMSPRMRRHVRKIYYEQLVFDVHRTEKGAKVIDEDHPSYEFKYLRNQEIKIVFDRPELFLKMLEAEKDGLIEVVVRLQKDKRVKDELYRAIESDNFSEVADAWNKLRRECIDAAFEKLHKIIARGVKDTIKNECENRIATDCRKAYHERLDQAPYRPTGMVLGTVPRVLAISNGQGNKGDAICWAYMEESGRVQENGKFNDLRLGNAEKYIPEGKDVAAFVELVERRKPDVIAVSGFSVETRNLYKDLQAITKEKQLMGATYEDRETDREIQDELDVVIVQDEVARLYHTSKPAEKEFPAFPPLTRYCVALARYMQDPLKEYAALGSGITSISFDPSQKLIPEDKLLRALNTAIQDMVNLVGVDINAAVSDEYTANLLQHVCGLGPRKAKHMVNVIRQNGSEVVSRADLVGDVDRNLRQAVGPIVWTNCASSIFIHYGDVEQEGPEADPLDNTRIHPEDYDLARKIAADALELDEEDVKAEADENGASAVVRRLQKDEQTDRVNDLVLEEYADQLEKQMHQRKRATLETIRAELQVAYEELRHNFNYLSSEQTFTMLTGETRDSLQEGMIVPVSVKRTFGDHIETKLDCGILGTVADSEFPEDIYRDVQDGKREPRHIWTTHQVIRGKIKFLNKKSMEAELTLREVEMRKPFRRHFDHGLDEWDEELEARDRKESRKVVDKETGRAQRVIKHPDFRPFNSAQAVEYLGPLGRGSCVIRPSSKGPDHLAVTWKVHEGVFQHIDVLELDKENEFSVGRVLRIGGKWSYSDLDELIAEHVRTMAKKVEEMMGDERYQSGSRQQTEQWLTTYTEANPRRSMYAFCLNTKYPGYFLLCFKAGGDAPLANWPVKVIPNAFELKGNKYPDMRALKNGFKLLFANSGPGGAGANGIPRR
ncbi:Transcription elongation factor spt6 [Recurvomyces mirabilis]|uniref:Transcription elongation factor Spt6 n=1 Tax=Recurvomyces mirabilis TaxID=574656 RepID=A0AAE1C5R2_9PEZI|nr:Transcription elongation factor spt6 [Recurvomyces mirabilis]KAK5161484.1 Transcription elongation factor spt6 [Recurvomyces mirabilis]